MQSPMPTQHATLSCCSSQPAQMQCMCLQRCIMVPAVAHCCMTSFTSTPSPINTIQALANFPPEPEDISLLHTHASYSKQPVPELVNNDCENWTLTLNVPIPEDMVYPTLTSFSYTIKYSTANHNWASVVQSHIMLAASGSEAIPAEIGAVSGANRNHLDGITVTPQTFQGATTMRLSSVQGIKKKDVEGEWNHFTDNQQIPLHVRIVESSCLYLQLQVSEYPTAAMQRSLSVDVSATWQEDQEGKHLIKKLREAEIRADVAEAKAAAEEASRKAAEAHEAVDEQAREIAKANQHAAERQSAADEKLRKAVEEETIKANSEKQEAEANAEAHRIAGEATEANAEKAILAREDAVYHYEKEHEERVTADIKADAEKHAREEAEARPQAAQTAAKGADEKEQERIKKTLDSLPAVRRRHNGYAWIKEAAGFRCSDGGHDVTWEELDVVHTAKVAEENEQEKIKKALDNLPAVRRCPNGYAWIKEAAGFRCSGGGHHVTWEELDAGHAAKVADEKEQLKIKKALDNLPVVRRCHNGYAWVQESAGYRCSGGGHHITLEELNHPERIATKKIKIADEKEQAKIKKALKNLPRGRKCPNRYAWVQEEGGYRCKGGNHHINWEELKLGH